jgi:hypothetical protein
MQFLEIGNVAGFAVSIGQVKVVPRAIMPRLPQNTDKWRDPDSAGKEDCGPVDVGMQVKISSGAFQLDRNPDCRRIQCLLERGRTHTHENLEIRLVRGAGY